MYASVEAYMYVAVQSTPTNDAWLPREFARDKEEEHIKQLQY